MKKLYVAQEGVDTNPGTRQQPLRSVTGARDRIRSLRSEGHMLEPVTVQLAKGTYPIAQTVHFGPEDSNVTYRGQNGAVIDGGERIGGWRQTTVHGVQVWVTDLPDAAAGNWEFRELFVNGERRLRARYPKFGYTGEGMENVLRLAESRKKNEEMPGFLDGDFMFKPAPDDVRDWPSLYDAEIVLLHLWTEDRLPNPHLNPDSGWVECSRQSVFRTNETFDETLARYYIDNLFEALTEPGEWYLDRHVGRLYYIPMQGEQPETTEVVAPRVCRFVQVEGVPFNREKQKGDLYGTTPVRNLRFESLMFRHADWRQPPAQMLFHDAVPLPERPLATTPQGAIHVPGTLSFMASEDCAVTDCSIEHIGYYGIDVGPGCRGVAISGNRVTDSGCGGVKIHGGELDEAAWRRTGHCSVCDNTIQHGGRVFHSAVGIIAGNAFENVIAHNHIDDFFYTGISVGWSWGYRDTISRDNAILYNHIHNIGQGLLSDLGAIYTLGLQPGTVIAGNHVHHVQCNDYGSWGLYLDEGSSHMVIEHNLVHDTEGPCLTHHFGRENNVRHNVFVSRKSGVAAIGRADDVWSINFDHNLCICVNGLVFHGGHSASPEAAYRSDTNWILYAEGTTPYCDNKPGNGRQDLTWEEWQSYGNENNSTVQKMPVKDLPTSPDKVQTFLQDRKETSVFHLGDPWWVRAGPRKPNERTPLWQPLWRH